MKIWLSVISLSILVFLAGCAQKSAEINFKNDVITIENYVVDDVAPYADSLTTVRFDIKNNADNLISQIDVVLFDVPGFEVYDIKCQKIKAGDIPLEKSGCRFADLEPLDTRSVSLFLRAKLIDSPTPYTVSFSIKYLHKGSREVLVPIIDGITKKEPSFQFTQSETTLGPIFFDILPQLEREKILDGKTIKLYWGITGQSFITKFVMKDRSSITDVKIKPTLVDVGNIEISKSESLKFEKPCDFDEQGRSKVPVNTTFNTLICNFKPEGKTTEYTSTITVNFDYSYEFIKSQDFVVQPKPFGGE